MLCQGNVGFPSLPENIRFSYKSGTKIEKYIAVCTDNMNTSTVSLPAPLELNIDLTDEQFFQLCQNNCDLRFERTATGELIIMPPTVRETGDHNADLTYQLRAWSRQNNLGKSFDSSTGFKLPNGAERTNTFISTDRICLRDASPKYRSSNSIRGSKAPLRRTGEPFTGRSGTGELMFNG